MKSRHGDNKNLIDCIALMTEFKIHSDRLASFSPEKRDEMAGLGQIKVFLDVFPTKLKELLEKMSPSERLGLVHYNKSHDFQSGAGKSYNFDRYDVTSTAKVGLFACEASERRVKEMAEQQQIDEAAETKQNTGCQLL